MHIGMILIDLQKAFDTLDHGILLDKMKSLNFDNITIEWFKSYLNKRVFFVNLENVFSEKGELSYGVPQGSILGPLLFLIYINDIPQALSKCNVYLYADDTSLLFMDKDIGKIEKVLNEEFASLCEWFVDNKLSIHFGEDKTKSILFTKKKKTWGNKYSI